ncbi:MAG: hypothetical protein ABI476_05050 [Oxalobacteraceae bacterium]
MGQSAPAAPENRAQMGAAAKADHVIVLLYFSMTELVECFGLDARRIPVVQPELVLSLSVRQAFGADVGIADANAFDSQHKKLS